VTETAGGTVRIERLDSVAVVTIDYPERRNALSMTLREVLIDGLGALMEDPTCRAIVLTGAGGHFSSGGELTSMEGMAAVAARERVRRLQRLVRIIMTGPKPVIAAVEGWAVGAGVSVVASCDIVVAASDSRFSCPFAKVGLIPDTGAVYVLPLRMGLGRARLLMLTGDAIDAATAERQGLVEILADPGSALDQALAIARRVAANAPLSLAFTKSLLARLPGGLEDLLRAEADAQAVLFTTADFAEGRAAILEKRKPAFGGT
jgi:enoyl-CoA hydratase/carnithine racemase